MQHAWHNKWPQVFKMLYNELWANGDQLPNPSYIPFSAPNTLIPASVQTQEWLSILAYVQLLSFFLLSQTSFPLEMFP